MKMGGLCCEIILNEWRGKKLYWSANIYQSSFKAQALEASEIGHSEYTSLVIIRKAAILQRGDFLTENK